APGADDGPRGHGARPQRTGAGADSLRGGAETVRVRGAGSPPGVAAERGGVAGLAGLRRGHFGDGGAYRDCRIQHGAAEAAARAGAVGGGVSAVGFRGDLVDAVNRLAASLWRARTPRSP